MTGPHGKPTTLDRIEARAQEVLTDNAPDEWGYGYEHMGDMWTALATSARDVLALVAVARAARQTAHEYTLCAEDANDGEFALWSEDRLISALVKQRSELARLDGAR